MIRNRIVTIAVLLGAAVALVHPRAARAVGEQSGRIRGVVTNSVTGEALEGVSVEATGPALIGPPRTTMTSGNGRYELARLPPGSYTVSFSYPGTVAATRKITLLQGEAAALNVEYALLSQGV